MFGAAACMYDCACAATEMGETLTAGAGDVGML